MIYTTLNRIRAHSPCATGWSKLLAHLGKTGADDEPLAMTTIIDSNGIEDALWCLRAEPQHANIWRLFAVRCARRVQHLMTDPRSLRALDVAEAHAWGRATDDELAAAKDAAWAAVRAAVRAAAWDARDAAWVAAWAAAGDAGDAAWAAAWAARGAARDAMSAGLRAALTAYEAAPGCVGVPVVAEVDHA